MPAIPGYESQRTAQVNRRIIEQPTFAPDTSMGDAAMKVAQVGLEITARVQKAETDRQVVTATRLAREQYEKVKFDLEQDQEIKDEDILPTLRKRGEEILSKAGEGINSRTGRDLWQEELKGTLLLDGDAWSRREQIKRGVDRVRGGHIAAQSQMEAKAGDPTISADAFEANINDERKAIALSRSRGFIGDEEVARYNAVLDTLGVKDRTLRFTANLDALMKDGRVAEAEALYQAQMGKNSDGRGAVDPDTLARVRTGLDQAKQEFAVIESSDKFWAAAKGDLAKYNQLVSGVQDVPKRLKMEQRGITLANQAKAARDAEQDQMQQGLWEHVVGGGTIASYSPSKIAALDPNRLGSIRAYENARDAEKGMTGPQKQAWMDASADTKAGLEWFSRNNPAAFMGRVDTWPENLQRAYAGMTPDDQRAVATKQLEMQDKGRTSDAVDKVMQDALSEARRFAPSIMDSAKDNDAKRMQFEGIMYRNAKALSMTQGGNPISPEQARKIVLQSMAEYDQKKYGEGVNVALGYMQAEDAAVENPALWAKIADQQKAKLGRAPTRLEVLQAYNAVTGN